MKMASEAAKKWWSENFLTLGVDIQPRYRDSYLGCSGFDAGFVRGAASVQSPAVDRAEIVALIQGKCREVFREEIHLSINGSTQYRFDRIGETIYDLLASAVSLPSPTRKLKPGPYKAWCEEHQQAPPCLICDYEDMPSPAVDRAEIVAMLDWETCARCKAGQVVHIQTLDHGVQVPRHGYPDNLYVYNCTAIGSRLYDLLAERCGWVK